MILLIFIIVKFEINYWRLNILHPHSTNIYKVINTKQRDDKEKLLKHLWWYELLCGTITTTSSSSSSEGYLLFNQTKLEGLRFLRKVSSSSCCRIQGTCVSSVSVSALHHPRPPTNLNQK